jgi:hypothetical protein
MTELSNRMEKAYTFAQEIAKQLMTLATAVFALTLTFADKIEKKGATGREFLEWAWGLYLLAILLGIVVLMSLTGHLADPPEREDDETIYSSGLTLLAGAQILTFFAALVLTLIYGIKAT